MDEEVFSSIYASSSDPCRMQLAEWQSGRLRNTYADLLVHPRYAEPAHYFLSDLYGPKDYSQRDQQVERVYHKARKLFPQHMVKPLADALSMNVMSQALDIRLCMELFGRMQVSQIDADNYVEAYLRCDNFPLRRQQIELIREIGHDLDSVVRKPMLGMLLTMSRKPAQLAGLGELQAALERGFNAFKAMHGADEFVAIIVERESRILEQIYSGRRRPFVLDDEPTLT